jgi:hypothetical protein
VSDFHWKGNGPEFTSSGGGRQWTLKLDEAAPGLAGTDGRTLAKLLALHEVSAVGRCEEGAFNGSTLTGFARHRGRIEATFAPPGWGGLSVRAVWGPSSAGDGVDLEVQVSATSVGVLKRLEVGVLSQWGVEFREPPLVLASQVEARDVRSAAASYDGRESASTLQRLTTLPVPASPQGVMPRILVLPESPEDACYIEMVQPNDCARRIIREPAAEPSVPGMILSTRYGLFGHDLEKGVVLRARLRGLWIRSKTPEVDARARYEQFVREPPPLGR